ncbi:ABC transporter ATP-binding protein [Verrucomicrobia bacterium LW23]|nr:ABC transporter ATP-binding protein [Verrucomicrobia bacterium LW23]
MGSTTSPSPSALPESKAEAAKPTPFALLWQLTQGYRGLYAVSIAALLVSTAVTYIGPLIVGAVIDSVLAGKAPAADSLAGYVIAWLGGVDYIRANLWWPPVVCVALTMIAGVFSYLKGRYAALASDGIALRIKDLLYDHLQRLPARFHDKAETGDLIQRCTSDVETLRTAISTQVVEISNATLLLLTALPVMLLLDVRMTGISLVLIVPLMLFGTFYFAWVRDLFLEVDKAEGQVTRLVQENLTGLRVVRAFSRQNYEMEKFAGPNKLYRDRSIRLLRLMAWYWSVSDFVSLLQNGLVLFAGVWFIAEGTLTTGMLFTFLIFLNMVLWPVRQMGRTLTELGKCSVALVRMGEILSEPRESAPKPTAEGNTLPDFRGAIEVRDLAFAHNPAAEHAALNGISFSVQPGQTLAILGPSGAGKSTIMHLLVRLYDYTGGSIRLDGRELNTLDRQWVRAQFSVVMQEPFLYSKTIAENISLGHGASVAEAAIQEAARAADIHETISGFPASYATPVGERGVTLSGGQRQRVALARALLRDTPVLLLDDAMSAVDAETEGNILRALRSRHGRRTTLVIAHRLSTLAHADRVIVLEHGRIIQEGTHAELLAAEGLYRRLWEIQNAVEREEGAAGDAGDGAQAGAQATAPMECLEVGR